MTDKAALLILRAYPQYIRDNFFGMPRSHRTSTCHILCERPERRPDFRRVFTSSWTTLKLLCSQHTGLNRIRCTGSGHHWWYTYRHLDRLYERDLRKSNLCLCYGQQTAKSPSYLPEVEELGECIHSVCGQRQLAGNTDDAARSLGEAHLSF